MPRRDPGDDTASPDGATPTEDPSGRPRESDSERPPADAGPDADHPRSPSDPRRIESLAVTESDVLDALEADARRDREIVLRVTPPFSGRMRARLHDAGAVDTDSESDTSSAEATEDESRGSTGAVPVHIPPARFVADPPSYPSVDDTEDELRASEAPYTRERHRQRHQAAVEEWRETVRDRLVETISLHTDGGATTVSVSYLG